MSIEDIASLNKLAEVDKNMDISPSNTVASSAYFTD